MKNLIVILAVFICCLNAFSQTHNHTQEAHEVQNKEDSLQSVLIYPNPVTDVLHIENIEKYSRIEVVDIFGKTVYSEVILSNVIAIQLNNIQSGIYFVVLKKKHNITIKKILKK